ncbi:hypothetical protein BOTBODRAFT_609320 [Botryobasidium botryosum FD-172 SS1]|uniref:Uncharacterized protein n=1 Tax=Botryobasidium botryosum (strain FD-172 SS1) TaxID=930990 RepID=A0A067LVW4_BOTB1|nr:hypothetical protein BOTBODRAFT_609320 [Botryobasidium botryosum FD-172 SS1]
MHRAQRSCHSKWRQRSLRQFLQSWPYQECLCYLVLLCTNGRLSVKIPLPSSGGTKIDCADWIPGSQHNRGLASYLISKTAEQMNRLCNIGSNHHWGGVKLVSLSQTKTSGLRASASTKDHVG